MTTEELAAAHDALDPLTNESTFSHFAETIRITCELEYQTRNGVTDSDFLAERAVRDCLWGADLTPRLRDLVRQACRARMRRLFARDAQAVAS